MRRTKSLLRISHYKRYLIRGMRSENLPSPCFLVESRWQKGIVDFTQVLPQSLEAIKKRKPLFEAAFAFGNAYARADVLNPVGADEWDIIEVKSSTEVKDVNIRDLALQWYAYEGAGLKIRNCFLLHINNKYVRNGEVDPKKLFVQEDVTDQVNEVISSVPDDLRKMAEVIERKKWPDIPIGPQCSDPYECPLQSVCWAYLPEDNVMTLYRSGQKEFELLRSGVESIVDIPQTYKLSNSQSIQVASLKERRAHIDKPAIAEFLKDLAYPLYFLDFETLASAIPLFDNASPYQQIPFQYSLHIVESEREIPRHYSFLAEDKYDPRKEILDRLKSLLGNSGSIVAYNAGFEKRILRESSVAYAEYLQWFKEIEGRFVDLLKPFRSFHYYHPSQQGSASIKAVLPSLTGRGYESMGIADGGTASLEFLRVTFGEVSGARAPPGEETA